MNGGVSLTISPMLVVGANQDKKISMKEKQSAGTIISVHLDGIWPMADQQVLVTKLKLLPADSHTTGLLCLSPQAILNKRQIKQLSSALIAFLFHNSLALQFVGSVIKTIF
jgi:hypothetical protein